MSTFHYGPFRYFYEAEHEAPLTPVRRPFRAGLHKARRHLADDLVEVAEKRCRSVPAADTVPQQSPLLVQWKHPALAGRAALGGASGMMRLATLEALRPRRATVPNAAPSLRDIAGTARSQTSEPTLTSMGKTMDDIELRPDKPGEDDPLPRQRTGSPKNKERRPAGTQAALDADVEKPLDEGDGIRNRLRGQSHPVRWLRALRPNRCLRCDHRSRVRVMTVGNEPAEATDVSASR